MKRNRLASLTVICLAVLTGAVVALSGCSGKAGTSATPTAPAAADQSSVAAPTIELVAPAANGVVSAGDVRMSVKTTGLKFVMASNTNVAGEGHVHFTLDDKPFKMSVKPDYVYTGVTPGPHKLEAELVQNDTKPFDPPVKQEINFTAE